MKESRMDRVERAMTLEQKGLVRIVAMSDSYPSSGIAANKDISKEVSEAVRKALIEFDPLKKDKDILYHWEKTEMPNGFVHASDSDYMLIRDAMIRLELLKK
jgi:phosphonate transport system substrate-binding protein